MVISKLLKMAVLMATLGLPNVASAEELNAANTAWILTSTGLVLFMTVPGIALFYGGLVRTKNVLSIIMSCFAITTTVSLMWAIFGYSLALTDGGSLQSFIGGTTQIFLFNINSESLVGSIPTSVFVMYQMTFAIFAPSLIIGSIAERAKFFPLLLFCLLWSILVYVPVCHWVWGNGWLAQLGMIDFAGGAVVHTSAGTAALVGAVIIGPRKGFPGSPFMAHNLTMTATGAGILWVGWHGFSAGSALMANGAAGMAMLATHLSASAASLTWVFVEWLRFGKSSVLGALTGMIAGLGAIAAGAGYVSPLCAMITGVLAGISCFYAIHFIKHIWEIDDALDVFPVHGISGILGLLLTAIFADPSFGGSGISHEAGIIGQFAIQCVGVLATLIWSGMISYLLFLLIDRLFGIKVSQEDEITGLDRVLHDQQGYNL
jgi:Amt family ammonium transporter